nr:MAG TPA: hypothetical protein [Caudoviricetes sp.]
MVEYCLIEIEEELYTTLLETIYLSVHQTGLKIYGHRLMLVMK